MSSAVVPPTSAATTPAVSPPASSSSTTPVTSPTSSSTTARSTSSSTSISSSSSSSSSITSDTASASQSQSQSQSASDAASASQSASQSATAGGGASQSQSASSAVVPSSVVTTDSAGSITTSGTSVTVPASEVTGGGKTSFLTVTVTNSNGQTQESVVSSISPSSKSSTNIGAIVGGTVGGVVGLIAILALLWFCVFKKRRNHKDDFDDSMFKGKNRHAAPGQTDILDDEANNNDVEPYTYGQNAATSPQMSQYATAGGYPASGGGIAPSLPPLTAMGGASTAIAAAGPLTSRTGSFSENSQSGGARGVARGPSSASTLTSAGFAGRGAQPQPGQMPFNGYYAGGSNANPGNIGVAMPMPMPMPYGQQQQQQQQPPSGAQQKAREAAQERQALRAANPSTSDGYYAPATAAYSHGATTSGGPSPPASGQVSPGATTTTNGVYVHSDDRSYIPDEEADAVDDGPSELPPQYHSIRRE